METQGKRISELSSSTDLNGLYTIGVNAQNEGVKILLNLIKDDAVNSITYIIGKVNGIAPLDASGKVPGKNLPDSLLVSDNAAFVSTITNGRIRLQSQSGEYKTIEIPYATEGKAGLMRGYDMQMLNEHQQKIGHIEFLIGYPNGIAPLDEFGWVPYDNLPDDIVKKIQLDGLGMSVAEIEHDLNHTIDSIGKVGGIAPLNTKAIIDWKYLPNGLLTEGDLGEPLGACPLDDDNFIPEQFLPADVLRKDIVDEPHGLCPLNSDTRVPDNNLPTDILRTKDVGKENGVAPLNASGIIPAEHLPKNLLTSNNARVIQEEDSCKLRFETTQHQFLDIVMPYATAERAGIMTSQDYLVLAQHQQKIHQLENKLNSQTGNIEFFTEDEVDALLESIEEKDN